MNYQAETDEQKEHKIIKDYANDLYLASDQLGLSEWEKEFCFDLGSRRSFSAKQKEKILQLAEKYEL